MISGAFKEVSGKNQRGFMRNLGDSWGLQGCFSGFQGGLRGVLCGIRGFAGRFKDVPEVLWCFRDLLNRLFIGNFRWL